MKNQLVIVTENPVLIEMVNLIIGELPESERRKYQIEHNPKALNNLESVPHPGYPFFIGYLMNVETSKFDLLISRSIEKVDIYETIVESANKLGI